MDDTTKYRRWLERHLNGGLDRRSFLSGLGLAGAAFGVAGGPMSLLAGSALP